MLSAKENLNLLSDITLAKHELWTIEGDRRGDVIRVLNGLIWITQAADQNDYILEAGKELSVTKAGTIVVQAMENSQIKYGIHELQISLKVNRQNVRQAPRSLR